MEYYEKVMTFIMDSLEEFVGSITLTGGKYLRETFYVILGLLGFSVLAHFMKWKVFISWQEALAASILAGLVVGAEFIAKIGIKNIYNKIVRKENNSDE